MNRSINWHLISRALHYYGYLGYQYMEVPWVVSQQAIQVTLPPNRRGVRSTEGDLVGSAEQSFIQLAMWGEMPEGRYIAATPCFRDDVPDEIHQRYFFKVELIEFSKSQIPQKRIMDMARQALAFMRSVPNGGRAEIISTPQGYDIVLDGVELGSYGLRAYRDFHWVYGTGIAEPRLSQITQSL